VVSPEIMPYLDFDGLAAPMRFPHGEPIDLAEENGLRVWVRSDGEQTEFCLQFHHACCDGYGANQFIEDLLCAYDHRVRGAAGSPAWADIRPELLPRRNRFGLSWWRWLGRLLVDAWGVVVGMLVFFLSRPAAVVAPEAPQLDDAEAATVPKFVVQRFSPAEVKQLLAATRAQKATLNDCLLRDFFLAIYGWNVAHDPALRTRKLRLMVPMDLRSAEDLRVPAANIVGMVNIDRSLHKGLHRGPRLLRWLKLEMGFMKFFRFAVSFNRATALVDWLSRFVPSFRRRLYGIHACLVTAAMSNAGRVFVRSPLARPDGKLAAGNLVVEALEGAPPHRYLSGLGFLCFTYAGQMSLVMNYDRRRFTRRAAEELFAAIVRQIEESAGLLPAAEAPLPQEPPHVPLQAAS
jgi:hypothetical protein